MTPTFQLQIWHDLEELTLFSEVNCQGGVSRSHLTPSSTPAHSRHYTSQAIVTSRVPPHLSMFPSLTGYVCGCVWPSVCRFMCGRVAAGVVGVQNCAAVGVRTKLECKVPYVRKQRVTWCQCQVSVVVGGGHADTTSAQGYQKELGQQRPPHICRRNARNRCPTASHSSPHEQTPLCIMLDGSARGPEFAVGHV